ncbi:MAG: ComF family protein [Fimbriimonadaceae bacterium]|nr:ComF family protein [Alphaproteobacteria bacterium]
MLTQIALLAGNFLLPPQCPVCRARIEVNGLLCPACWQSLDFIAAPYCDRMGIPFALIDPSARPENIRTTSARAIANPPAYDRARAAVLYNDPARRLVHGFKYRDRHDFVAIISRLMSQAGQDILRNADLLVPVPLHWTRLWHRRFNQSALLAGQISKLSGIPVDFDGLRRVKPTRRQVGLTAGQRRRNVSGAFAVSGDLSSRVSGYHVVLIDDVLTSGATVETAAKTLRHAGAGKVDVLTFALVAEVIEGAI